MAGVCTTMLHSDLPDVLTSKTRARCWNYGCSKGGYGPIVIKKSESELWVGNHGSLIERIPFGHKEIFRQVKIHRKAVAGSIANIYQINYLFFSHSLLSSTSFNVSETRDILHTWCFRSTLEESDFADAKNRNFREVSSCHPRK